MAVKNMNSFPIDQGHLVGLRCLNVQADVDKRTGEMRLDRTTGLPVWKISLFVVDQESNDTLVSEFKVSSKDDPGVTGRLVSFTNPVVTYYEIGDNKGISLRADKVSPLPEPSVKN